MPFCLSWNVRGINNSNKLKEIRRLADFMNISLICLQETKVNSPTKSIETIFPSSRWLKLFSPGLSSSGNYQGGLLTMVDKNHLKQDCELVDYTNETTSSHLICFENGECFAHVYQPHRIVDFNLDIIESFHPLYILGDLNTYISADPSSSNNNSNMRDKKIQDLLLNNRYALSHDYYTYGNFYNDSIINKTGPDHILTSIDRDDHESESSLAVTIASQLENLSDHQALLVEGDFDQFFTIPDQIRSKSKKLFIYKEIDRNIIDSFYDNLANCDDNFTLSDIFDQFDKWLSFCQKIRNVRAKEASEIMDYDDYQERLAGDSPDLCYSKMRGRFDTISSSVETDILVDNLASSNSISSTISKKCKISQFGFFAGRIEEKFDDARAVRYKFNRAKKFANDLFAKEKIKPITIGEIIAAAVLSNKNSIGYDNVPFYFLPRLRKHWSNLLFYINKHILSKDRLLHKNLRISKITFINRSDGQLRPISIGSRVATIIENSIMGRLQRLIKGSPVYDAHSGFISGRSIEQLSSNLISKIYKSDHQSLKCSILATDVSKAFDRISHRHVIVSLYDLVKNSKDEMDEMSFLLFFTLKWFRERSARFERLEANFERGVPQGSPLSCLLFVIGMNAKSSSFLQDVSQVSSDDFLYADDWNILLVSKSKAENLRAKEVILIRLGKWLNSIGLSLSVEKTHIMHLFQRNSNTSSSLRILGIIFDERMSFIPHFEKTKQWCNYRLNFFRRLKGIMGDNYNLAIWRQFLHVFRNKLTFGLYQMATISKSVYDKFNKLWLKCIKSVYGFLSFVSTKTVLEVSNFHCLDDYLMYLFIYRDLSGSKEFSPLFDQVHESEFGCNKEGTRNLRRKFKIIDIFWRQKDVSGVSSVSLWKDKIERFKLSFVPRSKNLKRQLKLDLLPNECTKNLPTNQKITEINSCYFNKLVL